MQLCSGGPMVAEWLANGWPITGWPMAGYLVKCLAQAYAFCRLSFIQVSALCRRMPCAGSVFWDPCMRPFFQSPCFGLADLIKWATASCATLHGRRHGSLPRMPGSHAMLCGLCLSRPCSFAQVFLSLYPAQSYAIASHVARFWAQQFLWGAVFWCRCFCNCVAGCYCCSAGGTL